MPANAAASEAARLAADSSLMALAKLLARQAAREAMAADAVSLHPSETKEH